MTDLATQIQSRIERKIQTHEESVSRWWKIDYLVTNQRKEKHGLKRKGNINRQYRDERPCPTGELKPWAKRRPRPDSEQLARKSVMARIRFPSPAS